MTELTTSKAALEAEHLLELFDKQDPDFVLKFIQADRHVLGAVLSFAHQAIYGLSAIEGDTPADIRRWLRATVTEIAGQLDGEG